MFEFILRRSMPPGATRRRHLPPGATRFVCFVYIIVGTDVLGGPLKFFFIELSFNCVFSCFFRKKKEKAPKEKRPFFFIPRTMDTNAANPPRAAFLQILSQQNLQIVSFILWCKFVVVGTFRSR